MDSFENINGHGVITQLPSWEIVNNNVRTSLQNIELVVEDLDRQLCLLTNSYRFVSFNSTDINLLTSSFYFTLQAIDDISADGLNTIPARQELLKTTSSLWHGSIPVNSG